MLLNSTLLSVWCYAFGGLEVRDQRFWSCIDWVSERSKGAFGLVIEETALLEEKGHILFATGLVHSQSPTSDTQKSTYTITFDFADVRGARICHRNHLDQVRLSDWLCLGRCEESSQPNVPVCAQPYQTLGCDDCGAPNEGPFLPANMFIVQVLGKIISQKDGPDNSKGPNISMQVTWHCSKSVDVLQKLSRAQTRIMQSCRCDHRIIYKRSHCAYPSRDARLAEDWFWLKGKKKGSVDEVSSSSQNSRSTMSVASIRRSENGGNMLGITCRQQ